MKFLNILTLSVATTGLISCQSEPIKTYYLTPYVTGTVLDKDTDNPIAEVNVTYTSNTYTVTDSQGYFELPAISIRSKDLNSWEDRQMIGIEFHIAKENYITRSYWSAGLPRIKPRDSYETPEYIHIGNVYLQRKSANSDTEGEFVESMTFCQPHESQKEANCIPKPVMDK